MNDLNFKNILKSVLLLFYHKEIEAQRDAVKTAGELPFAGQPVRPLTCGRWDGTRGRREAPRWPCGRQAGTGPLTAPAGVGAAAFSLQRESTALSGVGCCVAGRRYLPPFRFENPHACVPSCQSDTEAWET